MASEAKAKPTITAFTTISAERNIPTGDRSCGISAEAEPAAGVSVDAGSEAAAGARTAEIGDASWAGWTAEAPEWRGSPATGTEHRTASTAMIGKTMPPQTKGPEDRHARR